MTLTFNRYCGQDSTAAKIRLQTKENFEAILFPVLRQHRHNLGFLSRTQKQYLKVQKTALGPKTNLSRMADQKPVRIPRHEISCIKASPLTHY